jgi:hypothetical protein
MNESTPMRWPSAWKDPSALELLKGTAVNFLFIDEGSGLAGVAERARKEGLTIAEAGSQPIGVTVMEGEWPGVKLTESGMTDRAAAGPTGVPWIDSNGWRIRLTAALHPGTEIWVNAVPKGPRLSAESYVLAVADAAADGARWIISLDDRLAEGIAAGKPDALEVWKKATGAAGFFAARKEWDHYIPQAVLGVVSDFSGGNEFLSHEILNLVARTNQQYRVILKTRVSNDDFEGLRAVLYPDEEPPDAVLRKRILTFVEGGGMLITTPKWEELPGKPADVEDHPRYALRTLGKGKVAVAKAEMEDPYLVANDSVILISHRYELLRFWNGGALGSCYATDAAGKKAVVQMVFYASMRGGEKPTVRVAGRYRTARLWTLDQPAPRSVEMETVKEAVELYIPAVSEYAAVELEGGQSP